MISSTSISTRECHKIRQVIDLIQSIKSDADYGGFKSQRLESDLKKYCALLFSEGFSVENMGSLAQIYANHLEEVQKHYERLNRELKGLVERMQRDYARVDDRLDSLMQIQKTITDEGEYEILSKDCENEYTEDYEKEYTKDDFI